MRMSLVRDGNLTTLPGIRSTCADAQRARHLHPESSRRPASPAGFSRICPRFPWCRTWGPRKIRRTCAPRPGKRRSRSTRPDDAQPLPPKSRPPTAPTIIESPGKTDGGYGRRAKGISIAASAGQCHDVREPRNFSRLASMWPRVRGCSTGCAASARMLMHAAGLSMRPGVGDNRPRSKRRNPPPHLEDT